MTRLTDLPPDQAKRLAEVECPTFETRPWMTGPALAQRRIAIVSSAGLVVRGHADRRSPLAAATPQLYAQVLAAFTAEPITK